MMNVALLFNSKLSTSGGSWGPPVMERILGTRVIQRAKRYIRVSVGDILTSSAASEAEIRTLSGFVKLCNRVYRPKEFDRLIRDRLDATHGKVRVFCWLFQNMTKEMAECLNAKLLHDPAYLGAMDVDFADRVH